MLARVKPWLRAASLSLKKADTRREMGSCGGSVPGGVRRTGEGIYQLNQVDQSFFGGDTPSGVQDSLLALHSGVTLRWTWEPYGD